MTSSIRGRDCDSQRILQLKENLVDWDTVVGDARADINRAVEALRTAVRERDRDAVHLANLIDLYDENETAVRVSDSPIAALQAAVVVERPVDGE